MTNEYAPAAFTDNALSLLGQRLDAAESPSDFFAEVEGIVANPRNVLQVPGIAAFAGPLDPTDDGANSALVFETLGQRDPANAADPRLWSYLALVTHREYMTQRWSLESAGNWKARARDRWLMDKPTRRALIRNGISRLWWIAELTCDPRLERPKSAVAGDPFAYTKWVFGNEDRVPAIFERELGSSPSLMWAVIEALQGSTAKNQSEAVRVLAKEVRVNSGFRALEALSQSELMELVRGMVAAADRGPGENEVKAPPAGWHPDPMGRHQHRYWDGTAWTAIVADDGVRSQDPQWTGASPVVG